MPVADRTFTQPSTETQTTIAGGRRWNPAWTVRVLHVALWVVVASGPVLAVVALAETAGLRQHITAVAASAGPAPVDTTEPEGVATVVVADHLAAAGWDVAGTASLSAEEITPGVFTVTVTAHATPPTTETGPETDSGTDSAVPVPVRLFLTVAVAETGDGWVALGSPSIVAGPTVEILTDNPRGGRLDATAGLEAAVAGFLAAYLTGDGDVERYTAPDTALSQVTPTPFTTVEVTQAAVTRTEDGALVVSVTVDGVTPAGAVLEVGYRLVVGERDGRFEITDLGPAIQSFELGGSS